MYKDELANLARRSLIWSIAQAWMTRGSTLILFVVLARFLTPAEYGLATAALTVLSFLTLIAEFGYADAIIQRDRLEPDDQNLPFAVSLSCSIVLALVSILFSSQLEGALNAPGLSHLIFAIAPLTPLTTALLFQEANYKRHLDYKRLAFRVFLGNLIAGPVSIFFAYMGVGAWTLVIHSYLSMLISFIWLWSKPRWLPNVKMASDNFKALTLFGMPVVSLRILDFVASRLVDAIIISKFGIAAYGVYAVASRLYIVVNQLFQAAISDVSLSVVSKVSADLPRTQRAYIATLTAASMTGMPAFACLAAVSDQLHLIFGDNWQGVGSLSKPLLIVGAIQAMQFLNGSFVNARGKPNVMLAIASVKYASIAAGLLLWSGSSPLEVVQLFAILQLIATPLSFGAVILELKVSILDILSAVYPAVIAAVAGVLGAEAVTQSQTSSWPTLVLGIGTFWLLFLAVMALIGRKQIRVIIELAGLKTKKSHV